MAATLLVLAAGMGSRYGGLKQVDPIGPGGETVLDYSVYDAARAGFERVVFVVRREFAELFREKIGRRHEGRLEVRYAFQELDHLPSGVAADLGHRQKPLGTAHAIWCARNEVPGSFGVINADDFYGAQSFAILAGFLSKPPAPAASALVGFKLPNTLSEHGAVSRGVCTVSPEGLLEKVEECTGIVSGPEGIAGIDSRGMPRQFRGDELVSMNLLGFPNHVFADLEKGLIEFLHAHAGEPKAEYYIPTAVSEWIRAGKTQVHVLQTGAVWFGVTYRDDKPLVEAAIRRLIAAGEYPADMA